MQRAFDAKIRKVGNSYVVTVPAQTVERFKLKEGSFLTVTISDEVKEEWKENKKK